MNNQVSFQCLTFPSAPIVKNSPFPTTIIFFIELLVSTWAAWKLLTTYYPSILPMSTPPSTSPLKMKWWLL